MGKYMDLAKKVMAELETRPLQEPVTMEVFNLGVVRLHKTQPNCVDAGFCRWVTNSDCSLYPAMKDGRLSGMCRERRPIGGTAGTVFSLPSRERKVN